MNTLNQFKDWILIVIVSVCGWFIVQSAQSMRDDFSGMRSEISQLTNSVQKLNIKLSEAIVRQEGNSEKITDHEHRLREVEKKR